MTSKDEIRRRLKMLRTEMLHAGVDVYVAYSTDSHASEYVSDYYKVTEYLTGCTSDYVVLVIEQENAKLWTDGRFFISAAGELEGTGVTLMKMEAGLDTGPMIEVTRTPILPTDTSETLMLRLADLGAKSLISALARPETLRCTPQPAEGVTYAAKLLKTESRIDWTQPGKLVAAKIRAFNPAPGTVAVKVIGDEEVPFKLWDAEECSGAGAPGEVLLAKKELIVACGTEAIRVKKLQKAGKGVMDAGPFLQSFPLTAGEGLR